MVNVHYTTGLGQTKKPDEAWIGLQEDYDEILKNLNASTKEDGKSLPIVEPTNSKTSTSLEVISKASRSRIQ